MISPVPDSPIKLGSAHCCVCTGTTCNHIDMMLCTIHKQWKNVEHVLEDMKKEGNDD